MSHRAHSLAWRRRFTATSGLSLAILSLTAGLAHGQQADPSGPLQTVVVTATTDHAYAAQPHYKTEKADLGPLGAQLIQNSAQSVAVVPEDLIVNQQAQTVNDTLRYLPSVEIRDQQGLEVSRPQSRGFQGSVVQNTRLDGLNIIGTTAIAAENLSGIEVLNGLAGSLYGPETPAGVFNYTLKKPTDTLLLRYIESYTSDGLFTEQLDAGGRVGPDDKFGYRVNLVHGEGEGYVSGSSVDRTLASGTFDYHVDDQTVLEVSGSHYETEVNGLPGSIVYDGGASTLLPAAIDPTRVGYGQPGAGTDLVTNTGLGKITHSFNEDWNIELGGLYQDAVRNLLGITNALTDNNGNYKVTKNFNAVPNFTIGSNSAYLNGHFDLADTRNDLTIGTNGFINDQYSYRNSIAVVLGTANLADPVVFRTSPTPDNGGQYQSGSVSEQAVVLGDTVHFNEQWALQGVLSTSFISSKSYGVTGAVTSQDTEDGVVSPTVSLIYKPIPALTTYATFANSVEQGDTAPTGTVNANEILSSYRDRQYEIGAKYAVNDHLLVTLDGFRMTRPLAQDDATTNVFQVVGTQRNYGAELFVQGDITPEFTVLGGMTYIDARLQGTGNPKTDDKLVVGVPHFKTDMVADYHPVFAQGFALTGALHTESERAATNTNNSFADSFATADLGVRYATEFYTHHAAVRFQVINVGDTQYFSSIADGNIVGSPGANTAYSGAPRTFQVSIEMDF